MSSGCARWICFSIQEGLDSCQAIDGVGIQWHRVGVRTLDFNCAHDWMKF